MISASHITYYHLCHRKLWLHHRGMRQEDNSAAVGEGKLIGKQSYAHRASRWRELNLGFLKIDHFDPREKLVREVKKSSKLEHAHVAQVQYYLYVLEKAGIDGVQGILEYPKQRRSRTVRLTDEIRQDIQGWEAEIERIVKQDYCPALVKKAYCKNCAYRDFCFV
ncbi:CRISPR-associated protein Cas4 [Phaeodactylibacter xiamenensis]|uniref:CRISPR-associated protein Cas4 n=1 Tax=Phaeodactylibacter xiamenensis TaxID=1524460 RepID=UPI0024A84E53|nr:CRISPR-associated protein Cas4 [Phaeodactylibacter xiamenensis]